MTPTLRPAQRDDLPRLVSFVATHMPRGESPESSHAYYERVLMPVWASDHPNVGYLLEAEGEIAGCFIGLYSTRRIAGRQERICNLSAWCVKPQHRNHSLHLVRAILAQPGITFLSLAATTELQDFWRRMRLDLLDEGAWILPPLHRPRGLRAPRLVVDAVDRDARLSDEERRLVADHAAYGCRAAVLADGGAESLLILQRRRRGRLPYAQILYASDWDFAARRPLALALAALRLYRTPFIGLDRRRLLARPRRGWFVKRDTFFKSDSLTAREIDSLYSEVMLTYADRAPKR